MVANTSSPSAKVRSRLSHPVIDADGHILEVTPVLLDYIREVGGSQMLERYNRPRDRAQGYSPHHRGGARGGVAERRDGWLPMGGWWASPTDALDRATVTVPRLLNERLDELGTDFAVIYPSQGLFAPAIEDAELRRVACRAYNKFAADLLRDYADRMTPVAVIPMHTPAEAVDELEYAVKALGFKAVVMQGSIGRAVPRFEKELPGLAHLVQRLELFALDGDYDYDPVWARCVELKVAAAFHSAVRAFGTDSVSNYVYNHVGLLAASHYALCKALFLGGVTRRFPALKTAFLEGGVVWAAGLYADLIGHWDKRNGNAIMNLDPGKVDQEQVARLLVEFGDDRVRAKLEQLRAFLGRKQPRPEVLDDFSRCGIEKAEDIRDLFIPSFYFGCEADDPLNAVAFRRKINPFGAAVRAMFGSDIGHWDVPVMNEVVAEAYEMVEHGRITADDFRDFTFTNAVRLHAGMNPDFFKGTRVEAEAGKVVAQHGCHA